ncbi:unnamed protein product [Amoebophrya sp. A25]|nr:unnamed protein product [Amoebophrya sp. A25]|eukprot:GSA25T00002582001.1
MVTVTARSLARGRPAEEGQGENTEHSQQLQDGHRGGQEQFSGPQAEAYLTRGGDQEIRVHEDTLERCAILFLLLFGLAVLTVLIFFVMRLLRARLLHMQRESNRKAANARNNWGRRGRSVVVLRSRRIFIDQMVGAPSRDPADDISFCSSHHLGGGGGHSSKSSQHDLHGNYKHKKGTSSTCTSSTQHGRRRQIPAYDRTRGSGGLSGRGSFDASSRGSFGSASIRSYSKTSCSSRPSLEDVEEEDDECPLLLYESRKQSQEVLHDLQETTSIRGSLVDGEAVQLQSIQQGQALEYDQEIAERYSYPPSTSPSVMYPADALNTGTSGINGDNDHEKEMSCTGLISTASTPSTYEGSSSTQTSEAYINSPEALSDDPCQHSPVVNDSGTASMIKLCSPPPPRSVSRLLPNGGPLMPGANEPSRHLQQQMPASGIYGDLDHVDQVVQAQLRNQLPGHPHSGHPHFPQNTSPPQHSGTFAPGPAAVLSSGKIRGGHGQQACQFGSQFSTGGNNMGMSQHQHQLQQPTGSPSMTNQNLAHSPPFSDPHKLPFRGRPNWSAQPQFPKDANMLTTSSAGGNNSLHRGPPPAPPGAPHQALERIFRQQREEMVMQNKAMDEVLRVVTRRLGVRPHDLPPITEEEDEPSSNTEDERVEEEIQSVSAGKEGSLEQPAEDDAVVNAEASPDEEAEKITADYGSHCQGLHGAGIQGPEKETSKANDPPATAEGEEPDNRVALSTSPRDRRSPTPILQSSNERTSGGENATTKTESNVVSMAFGPGSNTPNAIVPTRTSTSPIKVERNSRGNRENTTDHHVPQRMSLAGTGFRTIVRNKPGSPLQQQVWSKPQLASNPAAGARLRRDDRASAAPSSTLQGSTKRGAEGRSIRTSELYYTAESHTLSSEEDEVTDTTLNDIDEEDSMLSS